jgi:hypothetical protein
MNLYSEIFLKYSICKLEKSLKVIMTQKDVALYYYVKMCLKSLPKTISFSKHLKSFSSSLNNKKHWL